MNVGYRKALASFDDPHTRDSLFLRLPPTELATTARRQVRTGKTNAVGPLSWGTLEESATPVSHSSGETATSIIRAVRCT